MGKTTCKFYILLLASMVISIFFTACAKKIEIKDSDIQLTPKKVENETTSQIVKLPGDDFQTVCSGGTIVVLYGYGYNDSDVVQYATNRLYTEFGVTSEDKSLLSLVYPQDFMIGNDARISFLTNKLSDVDVGILILLGAPTGTHKVLAELQDENITYPVFSIFSQDDVLGTEAGSTAVFDIPSSKKDMLVEEQSAVYDGDITDLIVPLVAGRLQGWSNFYINDYFVYVSDQILLHTGRRLVQYIDQETGIKSENHYILVE